MNKLTILFIVALIACVSAIHMQRFGPSTPGGQPFRPNGTNPSTPSTQSTILVNGRPYTYTGPFKLVCYNRDGSVFRWNSCYDANGCARLINEYRNCQGTVKKFNI